MPVSNCDMVNTIKALMFTILSNNIKHICMNERIQDVRIVTYAMLLYLLVDISDDQGKILNHDRDININRSNSNRLGQSGAVT